MAQSIIVFGGSGFIGTHCIRALVNKGGREIVSVDLLPPIKRFDGVDYRIGDVRELSDFIVPAKTARIYNFAAVHTTPGHPHHEYYQTNIGGAIEITRLASRNDIREIIFTSSISVYGPGEDIKTEDTPLTPTSAYGYSKMLAERVHRVWLEDAADRRLIIVRPAVVFGAGERGNFTRMASLLRKGFFVYPGRRDTIKACFYVEDLIEAIEFARERPERFVLFNGAFPQRYTLEQIVETFIRKYFPLAKTFEIPLPVVLPVARTLEALGGFGIGIHPDRVTKLVRSTNVYPGWLSSQGCCYPDALERAFDRWSITSNGSFV